MLEGRAVPGAHAATRLECSSTIWSTNSPRPEIRSEATIHIDYGPWTVISGGRFDLCDPSGGEGPFRARLELLVAGDVPELGQVDHERAELADVRLDLLDGTAARDPTPSPGAHVDLERARRGHEAGRDVKQRERHEHR
ncbi:hypothetical protein [Sorangium sp. So ce693]|uniref:hypothetical protein n=1 Tax=Sorangium sp. So ce693 TaxID=3133318 RepID=UPI003F5DBCE5